MSWPPSPSGQTPQASFQETAGASYVELIEAELRDEHDRRESIERRGLSLVTSTGVMVTIALALGPFLANTVAAELVPAHGPRWGLAVMVLGAIFMGAGLVGGLIANIPLRFDVVQAASLRRVLPKEYWEARRGIGSMRSAEVRVDALISARKANSLKALCLFGGIVCHVVGVLLIGGTALTSLLSHVTR